MDRKITSQDLPKKNIHQLIKLIQCLNGLWKGNLIRFWPSEEHLSTKTSIFQGIGIDIRQLPAVLNLSEDWRGLTPPLVPLNPPSFHWPPNWFSQKKVKNTLLTPLWFYHKLSTDYLMVSLVTKQAVASPAPKKWGVRTMFLCWWAVKVTIYIHGVPPYM